MSVEQRRRRLCPCFLPEPVGRYAQEPMASRTLDREIDRLYQLPLEEFTPARNALAKGAGSEASRIKALTKPPIGAWAVNQLYWHSPDTWNALIEAAENARRAHRTVLSGRAGDVRAATKVHDDAVEEALRATLELLAQANHPASDATKHAIATTLRALPGEEPPGRLTRMLQPGGFEMLTGLALGRGAAEKPAKPASAPARDARAPATLPPAAKVDAKVLTRARQEAAAAANAVRDAEQAARRQEFEAVRTTREEERAAKAVETAREALSRATSELKHAEAAATAATRLREAAARRSDEAKDALSNARTRAEAAAAELKQIETRTGGARR
jgi:hypothetical protein